MTNRPAGRAWPVLAATMLLLMTVAGPVAGAGRPPSKDDTTAQAAANGLISVASGLSSPVLVTHAGDGSGRLFVVEQSGKVRVISSGGSLLPTAFIDLSTAISKGGEQGLLGLAFHPSYETNGKFYVNFTDKGGDTAINEYVVSANPDVADRASGRRIISIDQPYSNHNGGHIAFGPDGYLYIGMGDGGGAGDPGNRAQSLSSLLGKMLRLDVNGTTSTRNYRIPSTNPYVGKTGWDEIWSRGLRNPWRWSFDRLYGDLWIGDVGQYRYEEIDRSTVTATASRGRGVNYGWRTMEGRACYSPSSGCSTSGKILPVVAYNHSAGDCSVIGGYVYRGTLAPSIAGRYLFGDFCTGRIWSISRGAAAPAARSTFLDTSLMITSFGEDEAGELYVTATDGSVRHIVAP